MIQQLHIQNFKCLRDVKVDLGPFTVFIGPNDSGKTSLVEAIQLLGMMTTKPLVEVFSGNRSLKNLVWKRDASRTLEWKLVGESGNSSFEYEIALSPQTPNLVSEVLRSNSQTLMTVRRQDNTWMADVRHEDRNETIDLNDQASGLFAVMQRNLKPFSDIVGSFSPTFKYSLDPHVMRRPYGAVPDAVLAETGENLVAVLEQVLTGRDSTARGKLEHFLNLAVPTIQGIYLPTVERQGNKKALEFTLTGNGRQVTIPADLASDGAVLLTAYLALAFSDSPSIVCIEEPEDGLHHTRLKMVIDLLRRMSTGEVGNRARQVIITTHSPLLLNYVQPEEVRIFRRSLDQGTEITPMDQVPDIERLKKDFGIGELWFLLGEERLVQGVPS